MYVVLLVVIDPNEDIAPAMSKHAILYWLMCSSYFSEPAIAESLNSFCESQLQS